MEYEIKKVRCLVCGEVFDAAEGRCPVCGVGLDQCEPIEIEPVNDKVNTQEKYLILGGGTAAFNAAKAIRERNASASIVMLTEEEAAPYARPMLTKALLSDTDAAPIESTAWYDERDMYVVTGCTVESIDPVEKLVQCAGGYGFVYDKLIYALGARCFLPEFAGNDLPHVVTIRTIEDVRRVRQLAQTVKDAVVIGGGVLGLEAAWALREGGLNVTVLEHGDQIMKRQIDAEAAEMLSQAIADHGVTLLTNAQTAAVTADSVLLTDGRTIAAELVIVSAGIRANIALAQQAGIKTDRHVIVDDHMRTSVQDVYACGDCASCGVSYGLWSEASEMGRIAGINAAGGNEAYVSLPRPLIFHGMGTALFALGDCGKQAKAYQVEEIRQDGQLKKYWRTDGRLVGALLLGDMSDMGRIMNEMGV